MDFKIEKLMSYDAEKILKYFKLIGGESDNLSFGDEGLPFSIEEECRYIQSILDSKNSIMLVAKMGENIIGECSIIGLSRKFTHRGELGISVAKEYWNQGIGSELLKNSIEIANKDLNLNVISLSVRSDHAVAIHLYEKYGFRVIGTFDKFFKINQDYFSATMMNLYIN